MRGSYYDVLGLAPSASRDEIRARYLSLLRRYHPDHNGSPLAHARTAAINEAFRFLSDPELRAWHDTQLAAQRQEAVSARAIDRSRGSGRALAIRRRPLHRRYGAQLALAAVLLFAVIAGWQIEHSLLGGDEALAALASDRPDVGDSDAQRAIAALKLATAREAQAMPPVSGGVVAQGVGTFRRINAGSDPAAARAFSEKCLAKATDAGDWDALDFCVAFDQAAFVDDVKTTETSPNDGYFIDRHDHAAHLYVTRVSDLDAIDRRLGVIRGAVQAQGGTHAPSVMHRISKRGWKLADAVKHVFGGAEASPSPPPRARDF